METLATKRSYKQTTFKFASFYNDTLEKYLENYDIAHQIFDESKVVSNKDKFILEKYCDDAYNKAQRLVTDSEFVGLTFNNLFNMNKILRKTI